MKSSWLLAGLVVFTAAGSAHASFIVNGSFEQPTVPLGSFTNFLGGSTAITGWTVVGVDSAVVDTTTTQRGIVFQAQDGNQWIDLAGVSSNSNTSGVRQDVATMIGTTYQLSFYVGSATDNVFFFPSTVDLSINGGSRQSYTNPTAPGNMLDWRQFTTSFAATGATTTITFYNGSAPANFQSGLDNVSLSPVSTVPEPATATLFGLGSLILSAGAWWRRPKASPT